MYVGKHNYVLHANCDAIARKMGNALCAPIVKFVPEGGIEPKSGHMTSPGTITAREETYQMLLTDIAESLQAHGFKNVIFIGDSGGNQKGQAAVADKLTAKWGGKALALHIGEYYDYASVSKHMEGQGVKEGTSDNMHDDPIITLNMFIDDPNSARYDARQGGQGDDQRRVDRRDQEHRAGEEDRRVPRHQDHRGDQQTHRREEQSRSPQ